MNNSNGTNKVHYRNSLLAGCIAGMTAKTFVAPLDRVKILFQVNNERFTFKGGRDLAETIYITEGVKGLWRGNVASLLRVAPYAAIQFTMHEQLKIIFQVRTYEEKLQRPFLGFLAGALSGATALTATYPLDLARARMATNCEYTNFLDVFRKSLQKDKNFTLYRGYWATLLGVIPSSGISFLVYEVFKTRYFAQAHENLVLSKKAYVAAQNLLLGTFVSLVCQSAIYPIDVVRRRIQTDINQKDGVINTFRVVLAKNGWHGLYNGLTLSWIKGPLAIGISMATFDCAYYLLNKYLP